MYGFEMKQAILTDSLKGSTSSLNTILKKDDVKLGYKIIDGNLGIAEKKKTIPHYMTMFI